MTCLYLFAQGDGRHMGWAVCVHVCVCPPIQYASDLSTAANRAVCLPLLKHSLITVYSAFCFLALIQQTHCDVHVPKSALFPPQHHSFPYTPLPSFYTQPRQKCAALQRLE